MKVRNVNHQPEWGGHVSTASYAFGYCASLLLAFIAFLLVGKKILSGPLLGFAILALAIIQVVVQLRYFLNFGKEKTPKWNAWSFFFMLLLLLIIVIGTLIIMANLDYRMVPSD